MSIRLFSLLFFLPAFSLAAVTVTIDEQTQLQTMDGFGAHGCLL